MSLFPFWCLATADSGEVGVHGQTGKDENGAQPLLLGEDIAEEDDGEQSSKKV